MPTNKCHCSRFFESKMDKMAFSLSLIHYMCLIMVVTVYNEQES